MHRLLRSWPLVPAVWLAAWSCAVSADIEPGPGSGGSAAAGGAGGAGGSAGSTGTGGAGGASASGGTGASGGVGTGGSAGIDASTGGTSSGGSGNTGATGGTATGGAGGTATGGTGGMSTGGAAGAATGGTGGAGGAATGGTGGAATGGTGGAATGGTGGAATGGTGGGSTCASGKRCGGLCVPVNTVYGCSTQDENCSPCQAPVNGTNPRCNGELCEFDCNGGYVQNGSSCVPAGSGGTGGGTGGTGGTGGAVDAGPLVECCPNDCLFCVNGYCQNPFAAVCDPVRCNDYCRCQGHTVDGASVTYTSGVCRTFIITTCDCQ